MHFHIAAIFLAEICFSSYTTATPKAFYIVSNPPANGLQFCGQSGINVGDVMPATLYMVNRKDYHHHRYYSSERQGQCKVEVRTDRLKNIRLYFESFRLDSCNDCSCEDLQINSADKFCRDSTGLSYTFLVLPNYPLSIIYRWSSFSSGFIIKLSEAPTIELCSPDTTVYQLPVNISSPRFPNAYYNNEVCQVTVKRPQGSPRIQIVFFKFLLEPGESGVCKQDSLLIGSSRFCGNHTGEIKEMSIPDNNLTIVFSSDGTIVDHGFLIQISVVPDFCNQRWTGWSVPANITSPGFPDYYQNNLRCQANISTEKQAVMRIKFLHFDLEADEIDNCKFDTLQIGGNRFCGNHAGETVEINTVGMQYLLLKLDTDDSVQRPGFNMELSFIPGDDICLTQELRLPAFIKSPNYPDFYPNHRLCKVNLYTTSDIIIEFYDFNLENGSDFLYVGQVRFTGSKTGEKMEFKNHLDLVTLKFTSDKTTNSKGFFLKVSASKPDGDEESMDATLSTTTYEEAETSTSVKHVLITEQVKNFDLDKSTEKTTTAVKTLMTEMSKHTISTALANDLTKTNAPTWTTSVQSSVSSEILSQIKEEKQVSIGESKYSQRRPDELYDWRLYANAQKHLDDSSDAKNYGGSSFAISMYFLGLLSILLICLLVAVVILFRRLRANDIGKVTDEKGESKENHYSAS